MLLEVLSQVDGMSSSSSFSSSGSWTSSKKREKRDWMSQQKGSQIDTKREAQGDEQREMCRVSESVRV